MKSFCLIWHWGSYFSQSLWRFCDIFLPLIVQLEAHEADVELQQPWSCSPVLLIQQDTPDVHTERTQLYISVSHLLFCHFITFETKASFSTWIPIQYPCLNHRKVLKRGKSDTFLLCFPRLKPRLNWNTQKFPSQHRHQTLPFPVREELTLWSMFRQLSSPSDIVSSFDCCWATPEAMESGQNLCTGRFWAVFFFVFGVSEQLESSIGWRIRLLALINLNTIKGKVNLGPVGC